jgi:dTDP-4-dehydrorhamnose reductase
VTSIREQVPFGIYHLTNGGSITTREVVEMIRETIAPERSFEFFESETEFMRDAVITPRSNCVLDNQKALDAGLPLRDIRSAIRESLEQWQPEIAPVQSR